jgi:heterodisulfide reductase subunit C
LSPVYECGGCNADVPMDSLKLYSGRDLVQRGKLQAAFEKVWLCTDCADVVDETLEEYD